LPQKTKTLAPLRTLAAGGYHAWGLAAQVEVLPR